MTTSDIPPTRTVEPVAPPPASARPTAAQLVGDIQSGRTGDKNPVLDPSLAPLGTDDEAAGRSPSSVRVELARRSETLERWMGGARRAGAAHYKPEGAALAFLAFAAGIGVVLVAGIWLARSGAPAF